MKQAEIRITTDFQLCARREKLSDEAVMSKKKANDYYKKSLLAGGMAVAVYFGSKKLPGVDVTTTTTALVYTQAVFGAGFIGEWNQDDDITE